jgi:hypothetical protein
MPTNNPEDIVRRLITLLHQQYGISETNPYWTVTFSTGRRRSVRIGSGDLALHFYPVSNAIPFILDAMQYASIPEEVMDYLAGEAPVQEGEG